MRVDYAHWRGPICESENPEPCIPLRHNDRVTAIVVAAVIRLDAVLFATPVRRAPRLELQRHGSARDRNRTGVNARPADRRVAAVHARTPRRLPLVAARGASHVERVPI